MSYSQTYLVTRGDSTERSAFFQCGDCCYAGSVKLAPQHAFGDITLKDIPTLIPIVQQQQDDLSYLCSTSSLPASSSFYGPLNAMAQARDFIISEITTKCINNATLKKKNPWLDADDSRVYFELVGDTYSLFPSIMFIANRVYSSHALIVTTMFFEGVIYVMLDDGSGDQPLLDMRFPDLSGSGNGATLAIYSNEKGQNSPWLKLSAWQVPRNQDENECNPPLCTTVKPATTNLSSGCYVQSYFILKSGSEVRDVMFRFGSW